MIDKKPPPVRTTMPARAMAVLDIVVEGPTRGLPVPRMGYHEGIECPPECDCREPA